MRRWAGALAFLTAGWISAAPSAGQSLLDRPPNLSFGEVGLPWTLTTGLTHRFRDVDPDGFDLRTTPTFRLGMGFPVTALAGATFSPSPGPGGEDEWELFGRWRPWERDAATALALTGAYSVGPDVFAAEVSATHWLGPLRVGAVGRSLPSGVPGADEARWAVGGGAVWHPLPGEAPVAFSGDAVRVLDAGPAVRTAWSAGVQVGPPYSELSLSLHASNTSTTSLIGSSLGSSGTRYGFELALPLHVGFLVGAFPARELAREGVVEGPIGAPGEMVDTVRVDIRRYAFGDGRISVPAGTIVEWVNRDDVVHTATAEDGAWDSGGITPGERWRARFDRPGTYPYYCGPHPYMKGVVIVR